MCEMQADVVGQYNDWSESEDGQEETGREYAWSGGKERVLSETEGECA